MRLEGVRDGAILCRSERTVDEGIAATRCLAELLLDDRSTMII